MTRSIVFAAVLLTAFVLFLGACEKVKMEEGGAPVTDSAVQDEFPAGSVEATTGTPATIAIETANGPVNFTVQIAKTDEQKAAGLMHHESLGENAGMWFDFSSTGMGVYHFWMKDTLVPLDWIFVDDEMKIVDIKADNKPNDETMYPPEGAEGPRFQYVLEVKAGTASKNGIKTGDTVQLRVGPAN
ncbi:MAG TPA: DUF192 domain-containing protein [bacterium]|nr:DUF192 domain-containing protein [bacterium]